jgi:cell division septation protein DedD
MIDQKIVNEIDRSLRSGPPSPADLANGRLLIEQQRAALAAERDKLKVGVAAAQKRLAELQVSKAAANAPLKVSSPAPATPAGKPTLTAEKYLESKAKPQMSREEFRKLPPLEQGRAILEVTVQD